MTVAMTAAPGWIRLHIKVDGVPAGKRCVLQVIPKSGPPIQAGSWLVGPNGAKQGTSLDGTALIAADDVASIDVITDDGQRVVSVPA
jgi:hypothetical protein